MRLTAAVLILIASPAAAQDAFRWVTNPAFQDAGSAHQGVVPLLQGNQWGLMGRDGQWVWPPQFDAIGESGQGRWPVLQNGKWGAVDILGQVARNFEFDAIGRDQTYTPVQWQGVWYSVGLDGQPEAEPLPFDTLIGNDDTCMVGTANGVYVAVNRGAQPMVTVLDGAVMAAPSQGAVVFEQNGRFGHLECGYGTISGGEAPYDQARRFSEELAAVRVGDGWGYVGIYSTSFEFGGDFSGAREFSEGMAPVQDAATGKWGYIDRSGEFMIPPQFDQAYSFSDGLAGVQIGDKRGFITPDGKIIAAPQFDDFWRHGGGIVPVRVGDLWGVIAPTATDPSTRLNLPLEALAQAQTGREPGFTLQPSNPHYYVFQDIASIHSIHVTPDQAVMVTTLALATQAEIALWDFASHRLIRKIKLPEAVQAVLLPGRQLVVAGLTTGHVVVLDAVTGAELSRIRPHEGAVIEMVLSPDGKWLATSDAVSVQLWDAQTGLAGPGVPLAVEKLRFSEDSTSLYAGSKRGGLSVLSLTGEVQVLAADGPPLENQFGPPISAASDMALTPGGVLVNLRSVNEQQADGFFSPRSWLEVVDATGSRIIDLKPGVRDILTLDVSADGRLVSYAGSLDEEWVAYIAVLDLATGAEVYAQTMNRNEQAMDQGLGRYISSVDRLGFAPGGSLVVVGMEGTDILLLDPAQGKVTASFASPLAVVQNQAGQMAGSRYLTTDGAGSVWVWDLAEGRLEARLPMGAGFGVEEGIYREGSRIYLFSFMEEGGLLGFDTETLQAVEVTPEEEARIAGLMFNQPDPDYSDELQAQISSIPAGDLGSSPVEGLVTPLVDGRIGVVSQSVGLNRAYDLATGALLAQFLATPDGEWLVVTPEGFFAASENGASLVSVSTGLRAFSVDQVYQALYRPDLVAQKLAGDPDGLVAAAAASLDLGVVLGSGPAPMTKFSFPRDGATSSEPEVEIEIELLDEGGGIGRVEWRLNGMTVDVQTRSAEALDSDAPTARTKLALEPGPNVIEVVAYNAAGLLASSSRSLTVNWDGVASSEPPALHVLSVGVNDYADGRLTLKYAAADAKAFAEAMKKAGAGLFSEVNVVTLLDGQVTEPQLDAAFAEMGKVVKSQDVFLFFLAGHGKTLEGKYHFIPQDFRFVGDDPIRAGGIDQDRWQEWASRVKARKSVMIYDTCESGSLTETRSVDAAMAQTAAVERLTRAMGRTILSASTDDAPALEGYQGHGVMTWAMLDALAQGDTNGNATIEVTELAGYLDLKVPEISSAAFGFRQVPQMSIKGSDFALGASVAVLGDAPERFPATLSHVVAGGTPVADAPGGVVVMTIDAGVFSGVYRIEERDGFARIAKDGTALGWVPMAALTPLQ